MTRHCRSLLLLAAAALVAGCVPTQQSTRGPRARGTEAWSWRMGATEKRWTSDRSRSEPGAAALARPSRDAGDPGPAAVEDEAEMTLEPDPVAPARKPTAVAVARPAKKGRGQPLRASDSDEEFLDKILNDKANAPSGEITMAAMEMPASKVEQPVKKKRMTRAEKRRARLLARAEKRRAREIASREARLRGKRARVDEEENQRASSARKTSRDRSKKKARKSKKGDFDENGEGFIDEDDDSDAEQDDVEREIAAGYDDEDDDADDEDEEEPAPPPRKKAKPAASKAVASKAPVKKVKTDWSGQAIDDEDPLKGKKK